MPVAKDFFTPQKGDSLLRSEAGLAYSDSELKAIESWIESSDEDLARLLSLAGKLIVDISAALHPREKSTAHGASFGADVSKHARAIAQVRAGAIDLSKRLHLDEPPARERHDLFAGDLTKFGLKPKSFDKHRNSEEVWDRRYAAAVGANEKSKRDQTKQKAARSASAQGGAEKSQASKAFLEYLSMIPKAKAVALRQRMADSPAFVEAAERQVEAVSGLIGMSASEFVDDATFQEHRAKKVRSVDMADEDLATMARHFFDHAGTVVETMFASKPPRAGLRAKAMDRIDSIRQEIYSAASSRLGAAPKKNGVSRKGEVAGKGKRKS